MTWPGTVLVAVLGLLGGSVLGWALALAQAGEPGWERLTRDGYFKQRPHFAPEGREMVFARHRGATILLFLRKLDSGEERRLTGREEPEYDAVFSPDGSRLAFAFDKTSPNQGDLEVYVVDRGDGAEPKPIAVTQGKLSHEESPCWSPDARSLAFTSTREGNQELFVVSAAGGAWKRLTNDPAIDAHPAWSPDGKWIAFATNRWGDLEIALVRPDGTGLRRVTESPGLDDYPAWSPDGRYLAFASNRDGNLEIYVARPDGTDATNATRNAAIDNFPAWTPDGRLGCVSNRDGGFDIYVMSGKWEASEEGRTGPR